MSVTGDTLGLHSILLCGRGAGAQRALDQLRAVGIEPHCIYPARDRENPRRGCYAAHTQALALARERNWWPCVIFEDNLKVTKDFDAQILRDSLAYASTLEPTIVMLARYPLLNKYGLLSPFCTTKPTRYPNLVRLDDGNVTGTVAYVAYPSLLEHWPQTWSGNHIDYDLTRCPDRYAVYPMQFSRSNTKTTNTWHLFQNTPFQVPVPKSIMNLVVNNVDTISTRYLQPIDNAPTMLGFGVLLVFFIALLIYLFRSKAKQKEGRKT